MCGVVCIQARADAVVSAPPLECDTFKGEGAHGACGLWWSAAPERGMQELGLMSPVRPDVTS